MATVNAHRGALYTRLAKSQTFFAGEGSFLGREETRHAVVLAAAADYLGMNSNAEKATTEIT